MYKNNPRMHSTQQNKKTVLTTAAYFKVSTSVMSQRQKKRCLYYFWNSKTRMKKPRSSRSQVFGSMGVFKKSLKIHSKTHVVESPFNKDF